MMNDDSLRGEGLFVGSRVCAKYHPSEDPMYRHNCYIEALPPPMGEKEVGNRIRRQPAYDELERQLPPLQRLHAVQRICNCVVPLPEHLQLEQKFSRMLFNGYMARNPLSAEWVRQMNSAYPTLKWGDDSYGYQHTPLVGSTASGFSIFGASGVGKTTLINSILSLYPQIIIHTQYNGRPFDQQQLVWLKLECPYDGSPRGLCTNFFHAVDRIIGTRYAAQYSRGKGITTDFLMPVMAELAGQLGMGVLVIDEIQRLRGSSSGSADKILSFFVQLTNTIGVPVILIGTHKAFSLFTGDFATARRSAGQGDFIFSNFARDDFWLHFVKSIWKYQWTDVITPLSEELLSALFEESQGIADIAVKLYMFSQWQVIGQGNEKITPNSSEPLRRRICTLRGRY
jgi:hypothetical protein